MQTAFNSIGVLALLGVVILLFANSALLKMVRDLQAGLTEVQAGAGALNGGTAMTVPEFAASDGQATYVLVVDGNCPACHERSGELAELSGGYTGAHLVALTKDAECEQWFDGGQARVVVDSALLGRLGVGLTPTMIKYAADGTEQWRRVAGSGEELRRLLDIAPVSAS